MSFITPSNIFAHWMCWNGAILHRKAIKRGLRLIWHTTIWVIWNNVIFNNGGFRVDEIVEEIKMLSWRWSLARLKMPVCLYYEWRWNPISCLCRWGKERPLLGVFWWFPDSAKGWAVCAVPICAEFYFHLRDCFAVAGSVCLGAMAVLFWLFLLCC